MVKKASITKKYAYSTLYPLKSFDNQNKILYNTKANL